MSGVTRSLLLGLALTLAAAIPASAATWSAPGVLSTPGSTTAASPSVAINDAGWGVAAWSETAGGTTVIRTAVHAPGGSWTTLASSPSAGQAGLACSPQVAIDPAGNALVAWAQWSTGPCTGPGTQAILWSTLAAGSSTWASAGALGAAMASDAAASMTAASNAAGQMVVGYEAHNGTNVLVFAAEGSPAAGFGTAVSVAQSATSHTIYQLASGIGPRGDAAVQWTELDGAGNANIMIATRSTAADFQPASSTAVTTLTSPDQASYSAVAIDAAGDALSAYYVNSTAVLGFASKYRPAGGTFGAAQQQTIAPPQAGYAPGRISLGFDGGGTAIATWTEVNFGTTGPNYVSRVWAALRAPGAAAVWTSNAPLTDPIASPEQNVHLAVAANGAGVISWDATPSTNDEIAIYRPAGGVFGTPVDLGQGAGVPATGPMVFAPSAAIAPGGDALVGFAGSVARDARVAVLDVHPPAITAMNVPATIPLGQAAAMSMTATDLWTPLAAGQPVWNFGDGSSAAGTSVAHAYAKAGTYTVTLTATDGAGNTSAAATRQITVPAPAGGGPGGTTTPAATIAKPKLRSSYVASKLKGSVSLSGTSPITTTLRIAIRKHGAKKTSVGVKLAVKPGKWSRTVRLPAGLLPGRYDVGISGAGVTGASSSFAIAAPKTGIASRSYASATHHGPAATRITSTSELWAHFKLAVLPKKGRAITTQWTLPGGTKLGANTRPRGGLVEAQVKDLKGRPLPKGVWHCVMRAGGTVVATATVRLG